MDGFRAFYILKDGGAEDAGYAVRSTWQLKRWRHVSRNVIVAREALRHEVRCLGEDICYEVVDEGFFGICNDSIEEAQNPGARMRLERDRGNDAKG